MCDPKFIYIITISDYYKTNYPKKYFACKRRNDEMGGSVQENSYISYSEGNKHADVAREV